MLSKKSKYSIKALVYLAKEYEKGPVLISHISESEHIPKKFLEAILLELKNAGILGSKKGFGGGYYLIKKPEDVKLTQVIRLTNGPIALLPCVSLNFYQRCEECVDEKTCGISQVAMQVRDATLAILENTSIADVLKKEQGLIKKKK
ncbi:MAG: Rrf2 family transcriptional regulator [Bacteroidia bacterium]